MTRTITTGRGALGRRTGRESTAGEWTETLTNFPMVTRDLAHLIAGGELTTKTWTDGSPEIRRYVVFLKNW